jgi:hypothetical protein
MMQARFYKPTIRSTGDRLYNMKAPNISVDLKTVSTQKAPSDSLSYALSTLYDSL